MQIKIKLCNKNEKPIFTKEYDKNIAYFSQKQCIIPYTNEIVCI